VEQEIRFCKTSDGVRIAYATLGDGPAWVRVPPWVSHLEFFWNNPLFRTRIEEEAKLFQVVRYDKRGTGLSDRNVSDFSVDARVRDLEAVVDDMNLRKFVLSGFSEGGPIAIAYAAKHPRRVSRLVLSGTFARGSALSSPAVGQALHALVKAEWGLGSATLSSLFMANPSPEQQQFFLRLQQVGATREDAAAMLLAIAEVDVSELLPAIKVPTLVVHGRRDRAVAFESGRELAGGIRNARLVVHEGGHVPTDEETNQFIQAAILEFLAEEAPVKHKTPPRRRGGAGPLTILFTDMESSTALTQRLGDSGAQELVHAHNAVVRDALSAHGGSEIKHTGDGIMASFASASGGLECAIAMQQAFAARDAGSGGPPVRVRIGLNAGEPVAEDADLFGTAVQLAKRVCDAAEPGMILASNVVRELAAGKGFLFADHGDHALRGFEDPVRLYEVRWGT
jgi:class 3 adenylate cyclase